MVRRVRVADNNHVMRFIVRNYKYKKTPDYPHIPGRAKTKKHTASNVIVAPKESAICKLASTTQKASRTRTRAAHFLDAAAVWHLQNVQREVLQRLLSEIQKTLLNLSSPWLVPIARHRPGPRHAKLSLSALAVECLELWSMRLHIICHTSRKTSHLCSTTLFSQDTENAGLILSQDTQE